MAKCVCNRCGIFHWSRKRRWTSKILSWFNGEVLLGCWANCGTIIAVRAIWSSITISAVALVISVLVDPDLTLDFNYRELRLRVLEGLPWFATVLAATYAAFYTRFSSQWTYAADLYNSIKVTECASTPLARDAMKEWKAGFIEDCDDLHLARKASFATTIYAWGSDPLVQAAFTSHAVGAEARLRTVLCIAAKEAGRDPIAIERANAAEPSVPDIG
jgi:hypothetical protein